MRLWIGIHFHQLSLDVLRPRWSADMLPHAVAVLESDQVVAMTASAATLGVRAGMRRRSVQAIAPQAGLMQRDPQREAQACRSAALALLQYTPEVALAEQGVVLLDVGASLRAFGGVRSLYRQVRRTVHSLGLDARIAMAPTATGAWLLACQTLGRRRRVLKMSTLVGQLNPLSCECLPAARPYLAWLQSIGCRTLGGLLRLPRAGLQRRTSTQLLQALDKAYGQAVELFVWIRAPMVFDQRLAMPERTEHIGMGLLAAEQLVEQMCGWLRSRQQAACSLAFQLEHERGRHAIPPTELRIQLAGPAWRSEHLLRLLRERLARTVLPAPFLAVRLRAQDVMPCAPPTGSLFADPADPSRQSRLLELLVARLGRDQVLQAVPRQDYRPEVVNTWQPVQVTAVSAASRSFAWPRSPASAGNLHPFWLLEQPVLLAMQDGRLAYGRDGKTLVLHLIRGPERIEAGWWSGKLTARDYFIAEDARFTRYWIYRERDARCARWFLHGMFA